MQPTRNFAVVEAVMVDGWQNLFRQLERNVDADRFAFGVGADDAHMQPAIPMGGCA